MEISSVMSHNIINTSNKNINPLHVSSCIYTDKFISNFATCSSFDEKKTLSIRVRAASPSNWWSYTHE